MRVIIFQTTTATVFLSFSRNVAHLMYVPVDKDCGTDFQNFAFKIFGEFVKFKILVVVL